MCYTFSTILYIFHRTFGVSILAFLVTPIPILSHSSSTMTSFSLVTASGSFAVPTSGFTYIAGQSFAKCSVGQCAAQCISIASCRGFILQSNVNDVTVDFANIGNCRLISFATPTDVVLGTDPQNRSRFYAYIFSSQEQTTATNYGATATSTAQTTTISSAGYDCTAGSNPCYLGSATYFAYSHDIVHFIQCSNGFCFVQPCSPGMQWYQALLTCA